MGKNQPISEAQTERSKLTTQPETQTKRSKPTPETQTQTKTHD